MKVAVGILTYQQYATNRRNLFDRCLETIRHSEHPFTLYVVDNGSVDGTETIVRDLGGYVSQDGNTTSGHGTNLTAAVCLTAQPDLVVLSDDDIEWTPGWLAKLVSWWKDAPDDVAITGCHLEPEYEWNTTRDALTCGGIRGLVRRSTGAGTWSFRAENWKIIGPIPQRKQGWGDVPTCHRLVRDGWRICQLDLAHHRGEETSTWGNVSRLWAKPLDHAKWGLE